MGYKMRCNCDFTISHLFKISSHLGRPGFIAHPDFHYIPPSRENILVRKLRRDIPYNIS